MVTKQLVSCRWRPSINRAAAAETNQLACDNSCQYHPAGIKCRRRRRRRRRRRVTSCSPNRSEYTTASPPYNTIQYTANKVVTTNYSNKISTILLLLFILLTNYLFSILIINN